MFVYTEAYDRAVWIEGKNLQVYPSRGNAYVLEAQQEKIFEGTKQECVNLLCRILELYAEGKRVLKIEKPQGDKDAEDQAH